LTEAMVPLLRKSAQRPRLIFLSSSMGSLKMSLDPELPWYHYDCRAYDASKAAVNMMAINYSRILADKEARVNVVCPGLVDTNMTKGPPGSVTPEVGAQRVVEMATVTGKDSDVTGTWTGSGRDGSIPW